MGGLNSYLIGCCNSNNNCPENHCKLKISNSNRSFTFNKIDESENKDLEFVDVSSNISTSVVNINIASEEILMTLPGVNRNIAHDIVLHRNQIGKFEKIEDLVLVNGIGAAKFKLIKPEISTESCQNSEDPIILINQFDVFQLTMIPGFTQTLAERIIRYRNNKGPFKSIKDLLHVRGMNMKLLKSIIPYLDLNGFQEPLNHPDSFDHESNVQNGHLSNGSVLQLHTEAEKEFYIHFRLLRIENKIINNADVIAKLFPNNQPTIVIISYQTSTSTSVKTMKDHLLGHYNVIKCNIDKYYSLNNSDYKSMILSNLHHYKKSMDLNSIIEGKRTCFNLLIELRPQLTVTCLVLLPSFTGDVELTDDLLFLKELCVKLASGNANPFICICDPSLEKSVFDVFVKEGYHCCSNLSEDNGQNEWSILQLSKQNELPQSLQVKIKSSLSTTSNDIIQYQFDLLVPQC